MRRKPNAIVIKSKLTTNVLEVLLREGYIVSYENVDDRTITVNLRYISYLRIPAIDKAKFISKPGRRIYMSVKEYPIDIPGILIVSTSRGLFSHREISKPNMRAGGEVLCHIF